MIIDFMDTLMAGLVPIECTISNYGVAQDNQEVLVHKEWADTNDIEYEECRAVGFIDEDNLWQDPTEVLFERDEFTIYGRIDDPIPSTEWNPLKLVDVVQSILPELGNELGNLQTDLEDPESSSTNHGDQSVEDELENYLGWVAEEQGTTLSDESKEAVIESVGPVLNPLPLSAKKDLFESAERILSEEVDEDMEVSAEQRAEYLSQVWQPRQSGEENEKGDQADENYLTTNFVAIYW